MGVAPEDPMLIDQEMSIHHFVSSICQGAVDCLNSWNICKVSLNRIYLLGLLKYH